MLEQDVVAEPDQRRRYLRTITQEADRLTRLIENVLDFARIANRRRTYRFEPLELHEVVGDAIAAIERPLAEAGMVVDRMVPAGLRVQGDRDVLTQLLVNLLTNAIKYAASEKRILVTGAELGDRVVLTVQDFGPGIPRHEQSKVFRPFYRAGGELTRVAPGSGLGLALVQEYARAHGGRVRLESNPGEGARFEIALPRA
ncbi:MAG: HAMP domain-containing histidine kinase [Candidatus Sericytochromatia bacterium]|nr:HAMP domain-containing histidine kinase [Candidatus Tanganyikabacteria bacterium]